MKHFASSRLWRCFDGLPSGIRQLARRNYDLLKNNPSHPSLQFKPVADGILWFWIGSHAEYDKLLG